MEQLLICCVTLINLWVSCRLGWEVSKASVVVHRQFELSCGPHMVFDMHCQSLALAAGALLQPRQKDGGSSGHSSGNPRAAEGAVGRALGSPKPPVPHQTDLPRFMPCATEKGKQYSYTIPSYLVLSYSKNGTSPCALCYRKAKAHFSKSSRSRATCESSCCLGY